MAGRMSDQIRFRSRTLSLDKNAKCSSDIFAIDLFLNRLMNAFELEESDRLLLFRDAIGETRSRSSCAFRVLKNIETIEVALLNEFDRLSEIFLSFTREANDNVTGQRQSSG